MRTSIEISDALLMRARAAARRQRTTLKAIVEQALEGHLKQEPVRGRFKLRDASFPGDGLVSGLTEGEWDRMREIAYEGRGS